MRVFERRARRAKRGKKTRRDDDGNDGRHTQRLPLQAAPDRCVAKNVRRRRARKDAKGRFEDVARRMRCGGLTGWFVRCTSRRFWCGKVVLVAEVCGACAFAGWNVAKTKVGSTWRGLTNQTTTLVEPRPGRHLHRELHQYHRCGLQNPHGGPRWQSHQTANCT